MKKINLLIISILLATASFSADQFPRSLVLAEESYVLKKTEAHYTGKSFEFTVVYREEPAPETSAKKLLEGSTYKEEHKRLEYCGPNDVVFQFVESFGGRKVKSKSGEIIPAESLTIIRLTKTQMFILNAMGDIRRRLLMSDKYRNALCKFNI